MKLINASFAALSIIIGIAAWNYSKPLISQNGTSVMYTVTQDEKKPLAVKLLSNLSLKQHELLNFAYDIAKKDGYHKPQYLQGIIMQESEACTHRHYRVSGLENKEGDRYFGCGQIKLVAARHVLKNFSDLWHFLETRTDEELQARLILDDKFNIRVASKYLLMMGINDNPAKAITSYNLGPGGAKEVNPSNHSYTNKVKAYTEKFSIALNTQ